ncbi:MFS transporter [archaeon]|jgi:MFS family permease|nr:MFS transporter [archaeon]MBT3577376.1 MFS transporter [archaeon]MBT6820381.1 MFS transporter [archaeon]MBT6956144.1 MFS transporter [archaeon]MBT7025195.1 MFS transporter [archaeon]
MKFSKKVKSLVYGIDFTHGMRRALVSALILIYFLSLGFNVVAVTTLFAVSTLIMTFFEFPTGAVADYDSRKKSLMISYFLIFVSFLGIFLFTKFWFLAFFWILGDIGWTFSSGAQFAWAIDALGYARKKSKLVKLISESFIFEKSGHVIGGFIGFIIVAINFRFIWLLIALSYLFLFFISWRYMEERNFKPSKVPHNYLVKSLIKAKESFVYLIHKDNRELRALMLGGIISTITISAFFVCAPLLLTIVYGLGPEYVPGLYAVLGILAIVGPLIGRKVVHHRGFKSGLVIFFGIMGISIISMAYFNSLILAIVFLAVLLVVLAATDVVEDSALHHEFDSKIRASLGSLNSINWAIAHSVGVFLTGIGISTIGVINTLFVNGGLAFLTAIAFLIGLKNHTE